MNTNVIEAEPTKELFISLLTKDIGLLRAILDLIDNSVDAAIKHSKSSELNDYKINITISPKGFQIKDNCGGMTLKVAKEYAFRFGKSENDPISKHSIGRFGIGMKRTLFKLGSKIQVRSNAFGDVHPFSIFIDIKKWKKSPNWDFHWEKCENNEFGEEYGVYIEVIDLYKHIKYEFESASFVGDLIAQIKLAHFIAINKGLNISVNDKQVESDVSLVLFDNKKMNISPCIFSVDISGVQVKIYCGLANRDKNKAGWYIFCNDRLIVEHDQGNLTGWGKELPKYHENYAQFRGYLFFDSDDPKLLPWTSTKTNLDKESTVYQIAYTHILRTSKPVLAVLREMATEKSWMKAEGIVDEDTEFKLDNEVKPTLYSDLPNNSKFSMPDIKAPPTNEKYSTLSVRRSKKYIDNLREQLDVETNKDMAEIIFQYFLRRRGITDE